MTVYENLRAPTANLNKLHQSELITLDEAVPKQVYEKLLRNLNEISV